jgi:hypothetical protein
MSGSNSTKVLLLVSRVLRGLWYKNDHGVWSTFLDLRLENTTTRTHRIPLVRHSNLNIPTLRTLDLGVARLLDLNPDSTYQASGPCPPIHYLCLKHPSPQRSPPHLLLLLPPHHSPKAVTSLLPDPHSPKTLDHRSHPPPTRLRVMIP